MGNWLLSPVMVVGAFIGGLIGGGGGAVAGQKAGTEIYKRLEDR
jgi:hypothetical protein